MDGYTGKLLIANLTTGQVVDEPLNEAYVRDFMGGSGLAARYLYDLIGPDTEPLGPDNPLILMTGPLVATAGPACGRHVVVARSPATGLFCEANSGGNFGARLRMSGYDGILVTGVAREPVYLTVSEGRAELHRAAHLWGQDSYAVQTSIRAERGLDERFSSIACIGPAGENLVKLAAVMNDEGRAAGRGGLGAVMGSKRLKAIAVQGNRKITLADEQAFNATLRDAFVELKHDFSIQMLRELGTSGGMEYQKLIGDVPARYWTQGDFEGTEKLTGSAMAESILVSNGACYRCPIACWRIVDTPHYKHVDGPEYETVAAFGSLLASEDLEAAAHASHLCNRYGLDTISAGSTIAFAYYLFNEHVVDRVETGGLALRWGDPEPALKLIELMARREGFGDILAEGSRAMERRYGVDGLAVQVNGLEVAMHDPRALSSMALIYATSPRGACHNQGDMYWVDLGRGTPELGILPTDRFESSGKAGIVARCQDWRSFYNSLIMCIFSNPPAQQVVDLVSYATGRTLDLAEAMRIGERAWTLKRALNNRLGLSRANDRLPRLLLEPLADGGTAGNVPNLELMLDEYYATREWDTITGRPLPEKLRALDLTTLVDDLWPDTRGGTLYDGLCIRRAADVDLPAILWLRQSMLAAMGSPLEAIRAGADEATAQVYTGETRAGRMAHFLAFSPASEPVALAGAVIRDEFPFVVDNPRYGLIMDIYISPHYRRRGLARRMIEEVGLWLRSQGVNRAKMVPVEGVREVLERLGFEPSREMERTL